ncbi:argininosuccinate lyase [Jannaschia rubra]|uniref:Uncharacterized protein n=1 Tax=Jannaschia rubra TaxID=282197 RepID=A0A0M6XT43_9RHOB|nr:argininosuccinate lyase [Jannaschia rubra]CTQ33777.1 hypothetical protein JAN5088_02563 [Jannaschia rubra]SFG08766.1 hypothetical protein SAMN04488517_102613 [Jannaschia rubra]
MIRLFPLLLLLGACGVDGAPRPPSESDSPPPPGLVVSGSAEMGVTGSF